jgi:hypothetical protein
MNDQFPPLSWYLPPSDPWGQGPPSVAEIPSGGILGRIGQPPTTTHVPSGGILGNLGQHAYDSPDSTQFATDSPRQWTLATSSHPFALQQASPHMHEPMAALDAYCRQIGNKCIAECSNTALPSGDYGFLFWNCVNKCMQRYGCPTVRG